MCLHLKWGKVLFSRDTDPLIIVGRCLARAGATQIYLMEPAKSVDESIRFPLVTLNLLSSYMARMIYHFTLCNRAGIRLE